MKMRFHIQDVGELLLSHTWFIDGISDTGIVPRNIVAHLEGHSDIEVTISGIRFATKLSDGRWHLSFFIEEPRVNLGELIGHVLIAEAEDDVPVGLAHPESVLGPLVVRSKFTKEHVQQLLSAPRNLEVLSGADLFALALSLSGSVELTVEDAMDILCDNGLRHDMSRVELAQEILGSARADSAFCVASNESTVRLHPALDIEQRLGSMNLRSEVQELFFSSLEGA